MDYGRNYYINLFSLPNDIPEREVLVTLEERLHYVYEVLHEEAESAGIPIEEHPSGLWAEGVWIGDLHRILLVRRLEREGAARDVILAANAEADEAAERLWQWLGWPVGDPRAREPLRRMLEGWQTRASILRPAVHLVSDAGEEAQRLRLGRNYVPDTSGRPAWLVPDDHTLYMGLLEEWIRKELRNAIEVDVLHETSYPPNRKQEPENRSPRADSTPRWLLPPFLPRDQIESLLERLVPLLTPMETKALPFALRGDPRLSNLRRLTHREIASLIGSTRQSVRQMRHRMRKKAGQLANKSC